MTTDALPSDWVSRGLGEATETYETGSRGRTRQWHHLSASSSNTGTAGHLVRRALLTPDEVRRLPAEREILFQAGEPPVRARKLRYFADPEFRGLFDASTSSVRGVSGGLR